MTKLTLSPEWYKPTGAPYRFYQGEPLPDNACCDKCKCVVRPLYCYSGVALYCDGCRAWPT